MVFISVCAHIPTGSLTMLLQWSLQRTARNTRSFTPCWVKGLASTLPMITSAAATPVTTSSSLTPSATLDPGSMPTEDSPVLLTSRCPMRTRCWRPWSSATSWPCWQILRRNSRWSNRITTRNTRKAKMQTPVQHDRSSLHTAITAHPVSVTVRVPWKPVHRQVHKNYCIFAMLLPTRCQ